MAHGEAKVYFMQDALAMLKQSNLSKVSFACARIMPRTTIY